MRKYELTITSDYVNDWTVVDAIRELFQNAIDQQTQDPANKMIFKYDIEHNTLIIANKESVLTAGSLLLGHTTKLDKDDQIGQFGEGYKIAALVLLRLGYEITFYNYGAREVWKPRMVTSRRYDGEKILTFFVDTAHVWEKIPNNNLTIVVSGITEDDYCDIKESNLWLQNKGDIKSTDHGDILLEERYAGKIYVNGLYVTHVDKSKYGYDVKPQYLKLGRDRSMVSSFDIFWETSRMLRDTNNTDIIDAALDFNDGQYIHSRCNISDSDDVECDIYDNFRKQYGDKAIPVYCQSQYDVAIDMYTDAKPVMVSEARYELITNAHSYHINCSTATRITTKDKLTSWENEYCNYLPPNALKALNNIINEMEDE